MFHVIDLTVFAKHFFFLHRIKFSGVTVNGPRGKYARVKSWGQEARATSLQEFYVVVIIGKTIIF